MSKFIVTQLDVMRLATSICEQAGIVPELVRRIVVDLKQGSAGMIYVEMFATDEMLNVELSDVGIEIREEPDSTIKLPEGMSEEEAQGLIEQWKARHS